jgi:hypothetical protein
MHYYHRVHAVLQHGVFRVRTTQLVGVDDIVAEMNKYSKYNF